MRNVFWFLHKDGHLGLGKRSAERAEQTRGRGGFCQNKSTSTGMGYLAGTELSSQLRNPVGSFALQEKCFYCAKTEKRSRLHCNNLPLRSRVRCVTIIPRRFVNFRP